MSVAASSGPPAPALVGRTQELGIIRSLLARSAAGEAQSLLVSGDAGIGKTALVRSACADVEPESVAIFGACLPLSSISIPFLPLRTAVRAHQRAHPQHERFLDRGGGKDFIELLDDWLDESTALAPTTLVVDDLHWADRSTLDALMYVISGPADRRITVVATYRKAELTVDHPVERWLTDIRRLPRITQMTLEPLGRVETGEQISALLGASAHQSLIDDVYRRTLGNPYFTKLMVGGLPAGARAVSDAVPDDLRSAVLRSWNSVGEATRHLATVLAVGARPMRADELAVVTARPGESAAVSSVLAPAMSSGSLERTVEGAYWFHHPLNAEVIEADLEPDERRALHARFADILEERVKQHPLAAEDAVSIADHRHRSGDPAKAYAWALAAADALRHSGGAAEQLRLLRRAIALHARIPAPTDSRVDLLRRLRETAARAGQHSDELEAVEALLAATDRVADQLAVSELIVRRMHLRFSLARAFIDQTEMHEAVMLSASAPTSAEHALALAELAHADMWSDDPLAPEHARAALEAARVSGDSRALSYALTANAVVAVVADDGRAALPFAREALERAVDAEDWWAFTHAALWEANAVETWASEVAADMLRRRREQMQALGAPHPYVAWVSASEAAGWMAVGAWRECQDRLRVALGSDPGPTADVGARLTAARLATWQGRQAEAEAHLERADELMVATSDFLAFEFDAVRAEVLLGAGDPAGAWDAALAGATSAGVAPTMSEWLMPLAARAAADRVQTARDIGTSPDALLQELEDLVRRFPHVIRDIGENTDIGKAQIEALERLYVAERLRAYGEVDSADAWAAVVHATAGARLPWEESYASLRAAEALLGPGRDRARGAEFLRHGLSVAEQLQARPILTSLEELGMRARIPIATPESILPAAGVLPGLTDREREILARIAAGRTYGEIARELVISEKTVSSHVSHLLAKTGTTNRVELSGLARRLGRNESAV